MQAIELEAEIDYNGFVKIEKPLTFIKNRSVRLIVLITEEADELANDQLWVKSITTNTAFDFLYDQAENIYSIADGQPFEYEK
jgi:hypothetical protein